MQQPIHIDLPHKLGRDEARRRIAGNIDKLERHLPGGANVQSRWGGDTLKLDIAALGETIGSEVEVLDDKVICRLSLPGMLGMFARPIEALLKQKGNDLLLEDKRD